MTGNVPADTSIALCLSGGGLRATLFHLGVVKALRGCAVDGQMALLRVREVYAVSGGSILAAHFLRNYDRYAGTDAQFAEVEAEITRFVRRDVRNRVLRRWLLTRWLGGTRSHWLQKEYEALLGPGTISASYKAAPDAPRLHILATSFATGELCSFSGTGFEQTRRTPGGDTTDRVSAGHLRLAYAVTASSSFPPMFPPVPLTPAMLRFPDNKEFAQPIELSDGGVYDNFGIDKFRLAERSVPRPAILLVGHAGGSFNAAPGKTYSRMLTRNIRASDIMMRRIGQATLETGQALAGDGYALVRIGATVDDNTLEVATQQLLHLVRTDLDAFDGDLSRLLVDHGCRVARDVFDARGWTATARPAIAPAGDRDADLARTASRAAHRSLWPLLLDVRDAGALILCWLIIGSALAGFGLMAVGAWNTRKAEAEKVAAYDDTSNLLEQVREAARSGNLDRVREKLDVAIQVTQAEARPGDQAPAAVPPVDATRRQQAVFIQFAGLLTRAQIIGLNDGLRRAGWRVQGPSGERTPAAAGRNEVRYSGGNGAAAAELAAAINLTGLLRTTVVARENPAIGANALEAWLSN